MPKPSTKTHDPKSTKRRYIAAKLYRQFTCDWAVYPVHHGTSMCYTTSKIRARLVALALNRFMNTPEAAAWLKKYAS